MSETLKSPDFLKTEPESNVVLARRRGRPKGAKNKIKSFAPAPDASIVKRNGRGRPKGSKNKPKAEGLTPLQPDSSFCLTETKQKRGRPKGAKNKPKNEVGYVAVMAKPLKKQDRSKEEARSGNETSQSNVNTPREEETHPLFVAAKWIEKNMHPGQMSYYRRRMSSMGVSMQAVIALDIMGLFSIVDNELRKQIKVNSAE